MADIGIGQILFNYGPMFLVLIAVFATLITFGLTNSSNRKAIGSILGIVSVIIFIYTLCVYFYFSMNTAYTNFYIIFISNIIIILSIASITVTALNIKT
jgi:hypothetical protein